MADFCYFCKKKIGFFDTSSRTAFAQTVCGNCVNKVNRVAILYNREFSEYTLYSLEDAGKILEKAPSFEMYISRYLKIRAEYEPQIQHYQELAEKEKKTLKEIEKGMDDDRREYEAELKECEKEWKAERASSDYKNELKEYACICFGFNGDGWSPYGAVAYGGSALFIDGVGENGKMNSGYGDIKISGKDMTKLLSYLDSDYNPTITIRAAQ